MTGGTGGPVPVDRWSTRYRSSQHTRALTGGLQGTVLYRCLNTHALSALHALSPIITRKFPVRHMSELSAYEIQRNRTIAENNAHLAKLGLKDAALAMKDAIKPKRPHANPKKRKPVADPDYVPERRVTRVSGRSSVSKRGAADDDSSDESSDSDDENIPLPVRASKLHKSSKTAGVSAKSGTTTATAISSDMVESIESNSQVVVEKAKTGRSKCRRCLEMLAEGELRVGAESWMVGRQVMVWQHPACFLSGVHVTEETSGRGKCKQTKEAFAAGEFKLSTTAHTTTSHFKLAAGAALLAPVLAAVHPDDSAGRLAAISAFDGIEQLGSDERSFFEATLLGSSPAASKASSASQGGEVSVDTTPSTTEAMTGAPKQHVDAAKQPAKGSVSGAKGRVCWRFGGSLCYGMLLPKQETRTHCYARTHKGNTKILTKGLTSWWMEEA